VNPARIQLRRTKGWRIPANTLKVDRTTKWGNPFKIGEVCTHPMTGKRVHVADRSKAIALFHEYLASPTGREIVKATKRELHGKNLACWCKIGAQCHADVLLTIANGSGARPSR
jgi:hypothetical protein